MNTPGQREREILEAALKLPPKERAAYLDRVCGGDAQLRQRIVEALFKAQEDAAATAQLAPLPSPKKIITVPFPTEAPGEKVGEQIGRYKLLEQIGEGGMGTVWVAEQTESVRRKVALKVIKLGMDTKQVIARFEAERQALAFMDHPNIAKVLDAGATETGRPYFVMELVEGIPITKYCDKHAVSTQGRIELFIQVCRAVQHAHNKSIIHRDISPSNILVTVPRGETKPVPKVIDFGIAKATGGQVLTEKSLHTGRGEFIGKPAYMSPEQAEMSGLDIDTRTDIYSLGVVLYELLTGQTPFDAHRLAQAGPAGIPKIIREEEPPRPSTKLTKLTAAEQTTLAKRRQTDPPKLINLIRGDLDWIVMKCLEKDRTRRYVTTNDLGMDLERHLNSEPVTARPPSTMYRLEKLVRRNKLAFAAGTAIVVVVVLGIAVSTEQAIRAAREAARATHADKLARSEAAKSEQVARFLKDMLKAVDPSVARGMDTKLLRSILEKTVDRLARELKDQPDVQAELGDTIGRVYWAIGDLPEAERMLREALAKVRALSGNESTALATSLDNLAVILQAQGKLSEAEPLKRQALAIRRRLLGNDDPHIAISLNNLALVLQAQGKLAEAETLHRECLTLLRKLVGNGHADVAESLNNLAFVLWNQGKFVEAGSSYREALAIFRKFPDEKQQDLAICLNNLALLLRDQGKPTEAEPLAHEALAMQRKLVGAEHQVVASFLDTLALVLRDQGRLAQAETTHREALAMQRKLLGEQHPDIASSLNNLAQVLRERARLTEAETMFRDALAMRKKLLRDDHPDVTASLFDLARVLHDQRKLAEAEASIRECLAIRERHSPDDWQTFDARSLLGGLLLDQKKSTEAEPLLQSGFAGMKQREDKIPAPFKARLKETTDCLLQLYEAQGQPDKAAEWKKKFGPPTASPQATSPAPTKQR